jgi:DNA-binding winged helix-turn-helix (wHTH) protein/tetratricopeptide (TPR) repeat protein
VIFVFGEFELDLALFELRHMASAVAVQPKVLDVLFYLVRKRDRVVSKQELLENVWPGEVVSETALTHAVMEARRAVRDDGEQQRIIQTVRRRGYRFAAPVDERQDRAATGTTAGRAFPEPDPLVGDVFVGRERPLALLHSDLQDALAGRGRLALVVGEPGIGKTRLVEQLAGHARAAGAEVLVGRSIEGEGAPAFWPWVQLVRGWAGPRKREDLAAVMGTRAPVIAQAIPEVAEKLGPLPAPPQLEPAEARFRLFDSLSHLFRSAAERGPLVLVLDDLHQADRPSLLLLQFLAREIGGAAILVAGTYRDAELARDPARSRVVGEIVREQASRTIHLEGLARPEVARLIEGTTGQARSEAMVTALHEQTGGNPFFLTQVVRLLEAQGWPEGAPAEARFSVPLSQGVRDAIRRHLDVLSQACHHVLTVASVIGREFPLSALVHAAGLHGDEAFQALGEALAARVVSELPGQVGRYRFTHSLIRETLYGELAAPRRVQLHGLVGEALAVAYGAHPEPHLAELAHHFVQAAPGGRVEEAVRWSVRAAEHAVRQLAYEQAAGHYERALGAMSLAAADDEGRLALLLALGSARWRSGEGELARQSYLEAADIARNLGQGEALARAALGYGIWDQDDLVDDALVRLLEEASRALGDADSPLRARVMGRLARELKFTAPWPRLESLSQAAVEMARRSNDSTALADALVARHWALWGPANTEDRFAAAVEIVELAEQIDNRSLALQGRQFRLADLLEMGDIPGVDLEIDAIAWLADELHQPQHQWFAALFRAMRAHLSGNFDEAERLAERALSIGERVHRETAVQWYGVLMGALFRAQGRLEQAEASLGLLRRQHPGVPTWRGEHALVLAMLGREAEARAELEALAQRDFAGLRLDSTWLTSVRFLAELTARLGDERRAELLYALLLPYEKRVVSAGPGIACYGSAARYLGILATVLGRQEVAERHLEAALELHVRMGARPLVAHTERDLAALLLESGERARARELASHAAATALELGMKPLAAEAQALLRAEPPPRGRARTAPR